MALFFLQKHMVMLVFATRLAGAIDRIGWALFCGRRATVCAIDLCAPFVPVFVGENHETSRQIRRLGAPLAEA